MGLGIKKQFNKTKKSVAKTTNDVVKPIADGVESQVINPTKKGLEKTGRRMGDIHDVAGIKGNYKKHYTWVEHPEVYGDVVKYSLDTPQAVVNVGYAMGMKKGGKDEVVVREYARYGTATINPASLVLDSTFDRFSPSKFN